MSEIDRRGKLAEGIFSYRVVKSGTVFISWQGKTVTTLSGKAAERFLSRIEGASEFDIQLEMARVTGNFKHGNERRSP